MKKILVVGGGFAGVSAAIRLGKEKNVRVTLISNRDYMYLYPMAIWVPVRLKNFEDIKISLSAIAHKNNFEVVVDEITKISAAEKYVAGSKNQYSFDYLIMASGNDKVHIPGIDHTHSVCGKPELAIDLEKKLDELVASGTGKIAVGFGGNPKDMSAMRGGPAFEMIFNIHNYLKRKKIRQNFELTFFAPMPEPGAKMGKGALPMLKKMFDHYNIVKHFGKKMKEFRPDGIVFEDDSVLESNLTIFVPAGKGPSYLSQSDLPLSEAGFIKVNDYCQVENTQGIYAVGDIAALQGPEWVAKQGHIAEIMGQYAAHNILSEISGKNDFKGYAEHLNILCIMDTGDGAAIVFRNHKKSFIIPLPIVGHWIKKAFGYYMKISKTGSL